MWRQAPWKQRGHRSSVLTASAEDVGYRRCGSTPSRRQMRQHAQCVHPRVNSADGGTPKFVCSWQTSFLGIYGDTSSAALGLTYVVSMNLAPATEGWNFKSLQSMFHVRTCTDEDQLNRSPRVRLSHKKWVLCRCLATDRPDYAWTSTARGSVLAYAYQKPDKTDTQVSTWSWLRTFKSEKHWCERQLRYKSFSSLVNRNINISKNVSH